MTAERVATLENENAKLRVKVTMLRKRSDVRKIKLTKQVGEIDGLKGVAADLNKEILELKSRIGDLNNSNASLTKQLDISLQNIERMAQNRHEDRSLPGYGGRERAQRSVIPDSIALIIDEGREPVETRVTTVRPKLRTPSRPNRPENH